MVLNRNDTYKYENNNICYKICPNGTHNITDNFCLQDNFDYIKYFYNKYIL